MTLSWDESGAGSPVLLVHSTVCDRRMWAPQMPALAAAGYRAIRCDLPGFGDTPPPTGPYDNAAEVAGLLDTLGVDRATLVGSSGGGRVALEFAARWPHRVTALALICTAVPGLVPGPELQAFAASEDEALEAGDLDAATELNVRRWLGPAADDQARAAVREMQRHAFEVQLAAEDQPPIRVAVDPSAVTAPTLLVSGDHDLPDFQEIAADLAGRLPSASHVRLGWAGHLPSLESPERFNPLLLGFLSEHVAAAAA